MSVWRLQVPLALVGVVLAMGLGAWSYILAEPVSAQYAAAVGSIHDTKVKSDISAISNALETYYARNHTYVIPGTGYQGQGEGWVAVSSGAGADSYYTTSIMGKLRDGGYLAGSISDDKSYTYAKDPTPRNYMLYICDGGQTYALAATLQNGSTADKAKQKTSCNANVTSKFAKNYVVGTSHKSVTTKAIQKAMLPTCSLALNRATSTLSWSTNNADAVMLQSGQGTPARVVASSTIKIPPVTLTTKYTIIATNSTGSVKCSVPRKIVRSRHATSTPSIHATSTAPRAAIRHATRAASTASIAQAQADTLRKALAEAVKIADIMAKYASAPTASLINGYLADMHAANAYAQSGTWSKVAMSLASATRKLNQATALVPRFNNKTLPDPSYTAAQNAAACGKAAIDTASVAGQYGVRALLHHIIATSSVHEDVQLSQSANAQAQAYADCFKTYSQQVASSSTTTSPPAVTRTNFTNTATTTSQSASSTKNTQTHQRESTDRSQTATSSKRRE